MEHIPQHNQGGEYPQQHGETTESPPRPHGTTFDFGYLSPIPPEGDSWDEWIIERGIDAALREGRSIDNRTAHYIAAQLHEGQTSALYSLASTGTIDERRVNDELAHDAEQQPDHVRRWIRWLSGYCALRPGTGPVDSWSQTVSAQDRADMEALRRAEAVAELDTLFGEQPGDQLGSVDELGWFGLVRHEGRPGGLIITQDEQSFRHVWETDSDQELRERWSTASQDYEKFYREVGEQEARGQPAAGPADRDRLAEAEKRLTPLPDLDDIPRPTWGHSFGSGWEWMEEGLPAGWYPEPTWGRDGWNLGAWPLVVVALFADEEHERFAVATYTEGDLTINRYGSRGALHAAVNEIAEFHWRLGQSLGPGDLPDGAGLLAKHCGPYSEERHDREVAEEEARRRAAVEQPDQSGPDTIGKT